MNRVSVVQVLIAVVLVLAALALAEYIGLLNVGGS